MIPAQHTLGIKENKKETFGPCKVTLEFWTGMTGTEIRSYLLSTLSSKFEDIEVTNINR
jgi:hypothetical protein